MTPFVLLLAAALLFGVLFDRLGYRALTLVALLSAGFAPLAFAGSPVLVVLGRVLWGIGLGAQESILRAAVEWCPRSGAGQPTASSTALRAILVPR